MNGLDKQAKSVIVGNWILEDIINRFKELEGNTGSEQEDDLSEYKAILLVYANKIREVQNELIQ